MNNHQRSESSPQASKGMMRVWGFRLFLLLTLIAVGGIGWAGVRLQANQTPSQLDPTLVALATSLQFTTTPSATLTFSPVPETETPAPTRSASSGTIFYAARSQGNSHLYALVPGDSSPVRLTGGAFQDRDPAVNPNGTHLAFRSNRSGHWDLFVLDLRTGDVRQITDTPGYEGHPAWSPDGLWLAYEAYYDGDFDIWIMPVDVGQAPIQLTDHPSADFAPAWDPQGRRIAFISHRDGSPDVYLADLDRPDSRFHNLTRTPTIYERDPTFSPDGSRLAFTATSAGLDLVMLLDFEHLDRAPVSVGQGRQAAWDPGGNRIAAVMHTPQGTHLQTFNLTSTSNGEPAIFPLHDVINISWTQAGLPGEDVSMSSTLPEDAQLYQQQISQEASTSGRYTLVDLAAVNAPQPVLSDAVDEAFLALKERSTYLLGWDFLKSLDNAFVGLNDPLPPGFAYNDWLYTGRAFSFNTAAVQAGWVEFVREDYGGQTYWRVYVLAGIQDGSLGEPLKDFPWEFDARHNGDPETYDQGGSLRETIPPGYYVDFTQMAVDFGFERLAAAANWRTFYPGARYNEFVFREDLDWTEAMLQLYPASALVTPTPYSTPTMTPTRTLRPTATPWWWRWRTPSPIPTSTPYHTPTGSP